MNQNNLNFIVVFFLIFTTTPGSSLAESEVLHDRKAIAKELCEPNPTNEICQNLLEPKYSKKNRNAEIKPFNINDQPHEKCSTGEAEELFLLLHSEFEEIYN